MTKRKNNSSVLKAVKGTKVVYLSSRDEMNGLDIEMDLQGYQLETL